MPEPTLESINKKLDKLLQGQERILEEETSEEERELEELKKLEELEKAIHKQLEPHPLRKITYRDVVQGMIGSFIGVLAHYTFVYGVKVAHELTLTRAIMLFPVSYIVGGLFMYVAGFRRVQYVRILRFLPLRLTVMFTIAVSMAVLVLAFFQPDFGHNIPESIKQVSTVTLLGVIGACTADLLGKE